MATHQLSLVRMPISSPAPVRHGVILTKLSFSLVLQVYQSLSSLVSVDVKLVVTDLLR